MFYSEEDIQPAVQVATELFGPVGVMLPSGKFVAKNVIIGTREFGKLWYGDVDGSEEYVKELCDIMTKRIGQNVSIVNELF
jgi:hypothetical protein